MFRIKKNTHFITVLNSREKFLFGFLSSLGQTDNLENSVCYFQISESVKEKFQSKPYNLIESIAYEIIVDLFKKFEEIKIISIYLKKPSAPILLPKDFVAVSLTRSREQVFGQLIRNE